MQEPLKPGDLCMVVRDVHNPQWARCYGSMVGTPVTLATPVNCPPPAVSAWFIQGDLTCPTCKSKVPLFFTAELQKLRGPKPGDEQVINVTEDGHGWRLCNTEVSA